MKRTEVIEHEPMTLVVDHAEFSVTPMGVRVGLCEFKEIRGQDHTVFRRKVLMYLNPTIAESFVQILQKQLDQLNSGQA